jgi:hypothetical protein
VISLIGFRRALSRITYSDMDNDPSLYISGPKQGEQTVNEVKSSQKLQPNSSFLKE